MTPLEFHALTAKAQVAVIVCLRVDDRLSHEAIAKSCGISSRAVSDVLRAEGISRKAWAKVDPADVVSAFHGGMWQSQIADRYGCSRAWVSKVLARYGLSGKPPMARAA